MNSNWNLTRHGFTWDCLQSDHVRELEQSCQKILSRSPKPFGIRNVLSCSSDLRKNVEHSLVPIARKHIGPQAFLVRSTLFDKPSKANWGVPWHQDVTIEVQDRHEVDGFGPWSTKDGLLSVQPPQSILENMVTLRLHFDDTNEENGALLVDPSSHRNGKLRIEEIVPTNTICCDCSAGDILVMRPLLFHASNRSKTTKSRRVLHLDFAVQPLPAPLKWREI